MIEEEDYTFKHPPDWPFYPDFMIYSAFDEEGNEIAKNVSYEEWLVELINMRGLNEKIFGRKK